MLETKKGVWYSVVKSKTLVSSTQTMDFSSAVPPTSSRIAKQASGVEKRKRQAWFCGGFAFVQSKSLENLSFKSLQASLYLASAEKSLLLMHMNSKCGDVRGWPTSLRTGGFHHFVMCETEGTKVVRPLTKKNAT